MGIKEKLIEKLPQPIKQRVEKEEYKAEIRGAEREREQTEISQIKAQARFEKAKELAKVEGTKSAERGSIPQMVGRAFVREITKPRADVRGKIEQKFITKKEAKRLYAQGKRKPKVEYQRPSFAPQSFQQPKQVPRVSQRPFITPTYEQKTGLSVGMEQAFFGSSQPRSNTAVERAFFGEPKPLTTSKVTARKRMIRVKRRPMF